MEIIQDGGINWGFWGTYFVLGATCLMGALTAYHSRKDGADYTLVLLLSFMVAFISLVVTNSIVGLIRIWGLDILIVIVPILFIFAGAWYGERRNK